MARRFLAATQFVSGYTEHQLAHHRWLGEVIQVHNHTHTCYPKVDYSPTCALTCEEKSKPQAVGAVLAVTGACLGNIGTLIGL